MKAKIDTLLTSFRSFWPRRKSPARQSANYWLDDCLRWHGRWLLGRFQHYCPDWDFLPIDDTVAEFAACTCEKHDHRGSVWLHVATGRRYVIVDTCLIEADLTESVLYRKEDGDGPIWCRPMTEFLDGRFKEVIRDKLTGKVVP